ncbi:hypothetical protein M409DRAFT_30167 [Zasmidium cellare ATCC 36951]|uniref:HotDog ACOT-type domain-containing protein n=1 Tax=Zasmidium cellare ATCC 36951 TaxID=1080233 RepID=A0A6A6BXA0_ZASCE|nr:uncharacterized protein M409DRAFT_30167 [Zasmidium cellare ATCC 36951]KAF2159417.1 hypothetical protein M409DRAFT_30167 [Zasmidium cellare ATCC 36951]
MPAKTAKGPIGFDVSISDPKERIQAYIDTYRNDEEYEGFESTLMKSLHIISASVSLPNPNPPQASSTLATTTFALPVVPALCNPMGNMHGGAVATLADMATTMATAPLSQRGFWEFGGVSRTLSVTYLKPVKVGGVVEVVCEVRSIGRRLSVTQCVVREKETGEMLALAEHGKSALLDQTFPPVRGRGDRSNL